MVLPVLRATWTVGVAWGPFHVNPLRCPPNRLLCEIVPKTSVSTALDSCLFYCQTLFMTAPDLDYGQNHSIYKASLQTTNELITLGYTHLHNYE